MIYEIEYTPNAENDIEKFKKSGNKAVLIKIDKLLDELRSHPTSGTGKPEKLKHYETTIWSRRINEKHRLIYRIQDEKIIVLIVSLLDIMIINKFSEV